jgi:hypothetical protein
MELVLTIDDQVASDLRNGGEKPLARRALELLAVDGYRKGNLSEYQVRVMLGFENRFEVDAFLKEQGAYYEYTLEEHDENTAALAALLQQHNQ